VTTLGRAEKVSNISPRWVTSFGFIPFFPEDNGCVSALLSDTHKKVLERWWSFWQMTQQTF
jgi:hypothetical protein